MQQYQYQLERGSTKHICPSCHKKRFVRYVDLETKEYLPEIYGKCDRETNCAYHLNPYKDGFSNNNKSLSDMIQIKPKAVKKPVQVFFPKKILEKTRKDYHLNIFIQNLLKNVSFPFEVGAVEKVIAQYHLGTITKGYRKGAVTFPFIDINCNVRAIQVKQFDEENHTVGTDFLHSMIEKDLKFKNKIIPEWLTKYNNQDTKVSCFFGEHLLRKYPDNPIGLVEAPKTAVYNTLYFGFPKNNTNYLWLAVYNLSSLSFEKCKALKGRDVYLFPDLSKQGKAFNLWSENAKKYQNKIPGTTFTISDLLERLAPSQDREQGKDIADYLIKLNWRDFRKNPNEKEIVIESHIEEIKDVTEKTESLPLVTKPKYDEFEYNDEKPVNEESTDWSKDIEELETFFKSATLPQIPIQLNPFTTIHCCTTFITSHLQVVKANNSKRTFEPYIERLYNLKHFLMKL